MNKERFIKALTPKDTEEVKPGLFIQAKPSRKEGIKYRQIHPAAWDGKMNWRNFILGHNFLKNFLWFVILLFLIFSYIHDTQTLREFSEKVNNNKLEWCSGVPLEDLGIKEDLNEKEISFTLYNYSE